jgi:sugar (pentulose or hexulose) kinase
VSTANGSGIVAVVDVGKTRTKLAVVDGSGALCEERHAPSRSIAGPPYPHLDVEATIAWILGNLRELGARWPIDVVVPVAHGAAAALMSGDELALPVMDYEFRGPEELAESYGAPKFEETFSPPLPAGLNLGRQLHWQSVRMPEAFARVTGILLYPQYIAWRLSGGKASEVTSLGCHTDLWCPNARTFSSLARARGWDRLFSPMENAWTQVGPLRSGLSRDCRVLAGIHDSNASYLPHRVTRTPPFSVVSTGTWIVCMAAGGTIEELDPAADTLANVDAFGDPVPTSRFMGGRELEAISGGGPVLGDVGDEDVQRILDRGILPVPGFASEGGPFRSSPGRIRGGAPETARDRAALGILYCALMTDLCLDLVGARGPCVVDGSFARTPAYVSLLAALRRDGPVELSDDAGGATAGALALARWPASGPTIARRQVDAAELSGLDRHRELWRSGLPRYG